MINLVDLTCRRRSFGAGGFSRHAAGLFGLLPGPESRLVLRVDLRPPETAVGIGGRSGG